MVPIILLLRASKPDFAKMRQRSPLRNFITFLAKKQAPIHVSAVSSSFARMSFALDGTFVRLYPTTLRLVPMRVVLSLPMVMEMGEDMMSLRPSKATA